MQRKNIIHFILLFLLITSCVPKKNMVYMAEHNMEQEITEAKYKGLQIQQGDILLILISALDENAVRPFNLNTANRVNSTSQNGLNQYVQPSEYLVNEDGNISLPVLGDVYVKGMSQVQLKQDIEIKLKKYLIDPLVNVSLKNFNISILGEVKTPGQKTSVTQKLNIFQALSLAGDMTDFGDRKNVKLIRTGDNGADQVMSLDISRSDIVNSPYYYMKQNDILYIQPDRNKQVQANSNPNRSLTFQIIASVLGVATLIISLTR